MSNKAVFLDKDGTLVQDVPYNVDPANIRLMPGAMEGLQRLFQAGFKLIVFTNQSGIARGYFTEESLVPVREHLHALLTRGGVRLDGFYYCPHFLGSAVARYAVSCSCRKPLPGLVLRAAREHVVDLASSWAIGDILDDVEAGRRAGCKTILINNGHETEWVISPSREPDHLAGDLDEAAHIILDGHGGK